MKLNKLFAIGLLASLLVGCYDKGKLKNIIQDGYDNARANTKAKGDYCYYLGSVKFPYTDEPILEDDIQWVVWNKEELSKSLPLFAHIGLLTRQQVEGKPDIYHYDLTELGKEYQHLFPKRSGSGRIIYNNAFCYGLIKVDKVTNVEDAELIASGGAGRKQKVIYVHYDYHVLDIPEWATKSQEKLNALYPQIDVKKDGRIYSGVQTFYKGKDGNLYEDSLTYFLIQPAGKLVLDDEATNNETE